MDDKKMDINVIILPNIDKEFESLRDSCFDILDSCKTKDDYAALLKMALEESRTITLREIAIKKIQMLAEALQETEK